MKIDLVEHPECRMFQEWKEYISLKEESAVLHLQPMIKVLAEVSIDFWRTLFQGWDGMSLAEQREHKQALLKEFKEVFTGVSSAGKTIIVPEGSKIEFKRIGIETYIQNCMNATARNRYRYSLKKGFTSRVLTWKERNALLVDIYAINTSMEHRQGKEMSPSYMEMPKAFTVTEDKCNAHYARFIGCFHPNGNLVAYITAHFCGELAAASQILGHKNFLKDGVMLNVWVEFVRFCMERNVKSIVYSRWKDGTDGLKYWKRSVGLKPTLIEN